MLALLSALHWKISILTAFENSSRALLKREENTVDFLSTTEDQDLRKLSFLLISIKVVDKMELWLIQLNRVGLIH
jgi:hypothetical protein